MSETNVPNETTLAAMQEAEEIIARKQVSQDTWEWQYLNLIRDILQNGDDRIDRTGVGTRAVFGRHLDIDLQKGFPAVTTKKLAWKAVVSELLWFLEGSQDERRLCEILHGTRDEDKETIWTANAQASYWKPKAKFPGDLGHVYGFQWRSWPKFKTSRFYSHANEEMVDKVEFDGSVDQVAELIKKLKENPTDRRMLITAFNVGEIDQMALPPCHMMAQFFVEKGRLSCSVYMRSIDTMLGLPFNIASYALLTHMLAQVCGLSVGRLIMNLGDTHIYKNHLDGAKEQLERTPDAAPQLEMNLGHTEIEQFSMNDFMLVNYNPQKSIKLEMAV